MTEQLCPRCNGRLKESRTDYGDLDCYTCGNIVYKYVLPHGDKTGRGQSPRTTVFKG